MLRVRILLGALVLSLFALGALAGPAQAGDEICPWVKLFGSTYMICIPVP